MEVFVLTFELVMVATLCFSGSLIPPLDLQIGKKEMSDFSFMGEPSL